MRFLALILFGLIVITFGDDYSYESDSYEESIEERILGGIPVSDIKKISYQVGLLNVKRFYNDVIAWTRCGGVLIHTEVVLTAAHCPERAIYVAVFHGTTTAPEVPEAPGNIRVEASNIKIHANYKNNGFEIVNDIALLILPYALQIGDYVSIIPMASSTWNSCKEDTGEISGWGYIGDEIYTNLLHSVRVTPKDFESCSKRDPAMIEGWHLCIDGSMHTGTCQQDSGGPYVQFKDNGERYLCGINSYVHGHDCSDTGLKVFVSVAHYNDNGWICNNSERRVGCSDYNDSFDRHYVYINDVLYYSRHGKLELASSKA